MMKGKREEEEPEVGEMAKKAVKEGGSSYLNISHFIQHINQQVASDLS